MQTATYMPSMDSVARIVECKADLEEQNHAGGPFLPDNPDLSLALARHTKVESGADPEANQGQKMRIHRTDPPMSSR